MARQTAPHSDGISLGRYDCAAPRMYLSRSLLGRLQGQRDQAGVKPLVAAAAEPTDRQGLRVVGVVSLRPRFPADLAGFGNQLPDPDGAMNGNPGMVRPRVPLVPFPAKFRVEVLLCIRPPGVVPVVAAGMLLGPLPGVLRDARPAPRVTFPPGVHAALRARLHLSVLHDAERRSPSPRCGTGSASRTRWESLRPSREATVRSAVPGKLPRFAESFGVSWS